MDESNVTEFNRSAFDAASSAEKEVLCLRLSAHLSGALAKAVRFHDGVAAVVTALRGCGHDLWSYDEDDDVEVWGPNYAPPSGPGILITFRAYEPTEVRWTMQADR
jgi:hypothetical protein